MNAQHNINTKKPVTKVPILLSLSGVQVSNIGVVEVCVEENTRRRRHDGILEDENPAGGRQKATLARQGKPSTYVFALTRNGQTLGFDSESGESSHETRACLAGKRISAMDLYSRKGKTLLFFGTENGQCRALDIDTCKCVTVFKPHPPTSRLNKSNNLHSSDSLGCIVKMKTQNGTLATGSDNGQICIWDVTTGRLKRKWVAHEEQALTSIRFKADENQADFRTIYTTGIDRSVRIWDIRLKKPEVIRFSSHRNTPTDVVTLDSVVYSCAKTSIFMADTPVTETMYGANRRPVSLPALKHLEQQLNHDRHYPVSSRRTMRDIIRQRLKRLPLPQNQTTTNSIQHPLQQSVLASMPLKSNGLRPKGEYLLVHDLRSRAILRELNIVDSLTGIQTVANSTMFCSPDKGRRIVVLAGDTPSGDPKACCVNIDTGEMLYDLTMPLSLTTASRKCTAVARTDAASSASQIVMGWSNGAFVTWSLDNVRAENQNAAWREKHLATSLKHTRQKMTPRMATSERKKSLELLLKNVQDIRKNCESLHSTNFSWAEWETMITTSISKSQKAISLCMINRSMLTSEELELSVLAAATSGMMSEAIALMKMHVRTGIGTSDELGASVMDLLPFKYHFGYGPTVVPKVFPLYNIGNKASILIGQQCIQNIRASGRIPRENAIGGFIRLLCRCGFIEKALNKLDVSKSRGLRLGRSVYKALLQGLLESAGGNLMKMTSLMEEMIQLNIMPSDSEFQILTEANIAGGNLTDANIWLTKMIDAGTTIELGRKVGMRLLYARMRNFMASQKERIIALSCHERKRIENDLIMFCIDIAKQCKDLKHLIVHVLLLVERHEEAYRLILTLDIGGTPPFTNDLNQVMDWISKQKVPQPEISTTYFDHISRVAGDSVKGSTHACYMRALLFASRVDLALKHFTKLEKADGDAAAVLPPTVYNALLAAFEASDDLIGFKNTWTKMVANGNVNSQSYELMMKHHILRRNRNKTMTTYEEFLKTDLAMTPLLCSLVISIQTNFEDLKLIWRTTSGHRWKQAVTAVIGTCTKIAMHLTTQLSQQGSDGSNNILVWGSEIFFSFPVTTHETESDANAYRKAVMEMINALCDNKVKNPVLGQKILESLQNPPPQCYGALIDCLLTNGESTRADKIVTQLLEAHLVDEQSKEEKHKIKKISRAMSAKIIKEEEAQEKTAKQRLSRVANNSDILQNVITGLANGGRAEAALRVATRCIRRGFQLPQKHLWLSILKGALSRPRLGNNCWQIMKKSSVVLDNAIWTAYIRTKGSNSEDALSVLRQMRSQHTVATTENCSAVLESCVAGSNPEGTSMMLKLMQSRSMQIESEVFCRMIQAAVRPMTKEALIQGVEILQYMRSSGGRPDLRTCKAMFDSTAKLGDATTATLLMLQIQDTNEANRKKTGKGRGRGKGKGKEPGKNNIVTIDNDLCLSYVRSLCRGHQLATAVQFVRQNMCAVGAVDSGVVPGTLIWSTLLEGCARSQDIGRADDIYREMQERGVLSNRNGRRALASLYARFDKIENAISVLFSNDSGTEIAWPGLSAAKQLLCAICRHLDNIKSKATTRIAVRQLCLIFRSGNLQQRSDLVAVGKMTPMCIHSRLSVLKTTFNFPSILELELYFSN